jgi:UDP-N-acetylmuramoyl-L-alanyl-D-glutamate--2,6-diaminopimelate ligase
MAKSRPFKKSYWKTSSKIAALKYRINNNHPFVAVTGTDGKTTTASFLYEIAKAYGYKPFLLTTVSAKFDGKDIDVKLNSSSFFAYSVKNVGSNLKKGKVIKAAKNMLFLDKKGFNQNLEEHRTTPLASEIRKLIKEYEAKGADFFILEVTSHAIDQHRIDGIKFDTVIYTNITHEHLDYHGDWENYAATKAKLIDRVKKNGTVIINKDDKNSYEILSERIKKRNNINCISYFIEDIEKINTKNFLINLDRENKDLEIFASFKPSGKLNSKELKKSVYESGFKIFGNYNISNALAAFAGFVGLNPKKKNFTKAAKSLANLPSVLGRMNFISKNPTIIVDFAHTPNAMASALNAVSELKKQDSRLWVIFGCAGLRDKYKRPEMGKYAFHYADNILITSEDPRTESLSEINNQIISGFKDEAQDFTIHPYYPELEYDATGAKFIVRFDEPNLNSRLNAINFALRNMKENDIVIMLGKGHERSMCFGQKEFEWNDIEAVNKLLEQKG